MKRSETGDEGRQGKEHGVDQKVQKANLNVEGNEDFSSVVGERVEGEAREHLNKLSKKAKGSFNCGRRR